MATIRKEFRIAAPPAQIWDALRDFGAVHSKLARGFVTDTKLEEGGMLRVVTFANGLVARERLVTMDDANKRIVYAIHDSPQLTHYSASAQVFDDGAGSRFVWQVDLLPDPMAAPISGMMDAGMEAMRTTLS
jgi:carbon monoxide dehydrogenase subunit G